MVNQDSREQVHGCGEGGGGQLSFCFADFEFRLGYNGRILMFWFGADSDRQLKGN